MFTFDKEQVVYRIGRVTVGGTPGENPTVLAGSIFYEGDKIVEDAERGIFDPAAAEALVNKQDEMADLTGNPALVQIVASSAGAMIRYIDFIADITDAPLIIDSTSVEARLEGIRHCEEVGLLDNAIYNSLNVSVTPDEIDALTEIQPEAAIILAFNPQDSSVAGRRAILEKGALSLDRGLLRIAEDTGISKPLIDTATTAIGAGAGSSLALTMVAKAVYGLPTGSGIHNAPASWPWLRSQRKEHREAYRVCDFSSGLLVVMMGGDFVLYGPIKSAQSVFPVVAMGDMFTAEMASTELGVEPSENHPFRRLV
ncbi:MAG: tetrahydromethanopterin S-methyltransferase subunit H [Candidatus Thorarchaeota archaeon]|nr:MAG: tetrahydromethanopterin S-methyltransferase subunit H [Candidatus Latescibacterota bacterium]RLI60460.1 MAG: tetrahydromethanopterin S-methyltransferase subunit H [Candidatus Thorarchaeota archaeon]